MKITVNFTLDVPKNKLKLLRELAETDDNTAAAYFIRAEAEELVLGYIDDNGIRPVAVVRRDGRKVLE